MRRGEETEIITEKDVLNCLTVQEYENLALEILKERDAALAKAKVYRQLAISDGHVCHASECKDKCAIAEYFDNAAEHLLKGKE